MALIPDEIIAQVIDRTDIVEAIGFYLPLKRAGRNFKANCPFHHEKSPSFIVNPDKQIFHCFGCGVGGNVVSFLMKHEHMEFPEAVRHLAQRAGIEVPALAEESKTINHERQELFRVNEMAAQFYHKLLLSDKGAEAEAARNYLKKRGVELETVKHFQIGFALDEWESLIRHLQKNGISLKTMEKCGLVIPRDNKEGYYDRFRNRIIFPIFDTRANVRAFGARAMGDEKGAKYLNSPETPIYTKGHHLYGFHLTRQSIAADDGIIIVEGYMDCLIPFQYGVTNIVASLGTALTVEQIRLLRRYTKNIVLLFDADAAGQSAMLRSLEMLIDEGMDVRLAALSEGEDPDSFVRKFGADAFREKISQAKPIFEYKLEHVMAANDYKRIEGKAKICDEMLPLIQRFDNEVLKSGYIQRLARILAVSEVALSSQLAKQRSKDKVPAAQVENSANQASVSTPRTVEHRILKLLLEEDQYLAKTKAELSASDFQDQHVRTIISKVYELVEGGQQVNLGSLLGSFEDHSLQKFVTELMAGEDDLVGNRDKMHRDFLDRMHKDRVKQQKQFLMQKIHEAEVSGNHQELDELKKEFNQLIRK